MKEKKLKILILLFSLVTLAVILTIPLGCSAADCNSNCNDCSNSGECGTSKAVCAWDTSKSKCCTKLELNWPKSPMGSSISSCTDLTAFIKYFYEWGIILGGLVAFIALVLAGFQYLTSVGDPAKMADARNRILSAVAGLVLLLSSFIILNVLNPELTVLRIPNLTVGGGIVIPPGQAPDPDIFKNCDRVKIWDGLNCTGNNKGTIVPDGELDITIPAQNSNYSIQIAVPSSTAAGDVYVTGGQCQTAVYWRTGCNDDPNANPTDPMNAWVTGCINIKQYPLPVDIKCVKAEKVF